MSFKCPSLRSFCTCSPRQASPKAARAPTAEISRISGKPKPSRPTDPYPPSRFRPSLIHTPGTELFNATAEIPAITRRPTLINEDTARDLVREWGVDKMHDAVIVEPWAGAGGLTRAFLELKNVKRVIAIEEAFRYYPMLVAAQARQADPDRMHIIEMDPFRWETYTHIEELGLLKDVPKHPYDEVHPSLFLACQIPSNKQGEQLFFQFLAASATRMWYYQYGRFESGFLGPTAYFDKITSRPGTAGYHKVAVLTSALTNLQPIKTLGGFTPPELHFHKPRGDPSIISAVKLTPHAVPHVKNFDALEYVTRSMFISKLHPWRKAVSALAPGASNLIPLMEQAGVSPVDIPVRSLSVEDWVKIADVFDAWPFRPSTLFDDYQFNTDVE